MKHTDMTQHIIAKDDKDGRWLLGCDRSNGDPVWIHRKLLKSGTDRFGLLVYKKWEDAFESAKEIGDGAFAMSVTY